jgi:hypothetical protein
MDSGFIRKIEVDANELAANYCHSSRRSFLLVKISPTAPASHYFAILDDSHAPLLRFDDANRLLGARPPQHSIQYPFACGLGRRFFQHV